MKSTLFSLLIIFFSMFLIPAVQAQKSTVISGKVISSADGKGLDGVSVRLKGTSKGVTTDPDGNFEMKVTGTSGTLLVSFVGFITREIPLRGRNSFTITLSPVNTTLSDVVIIGYGSVKKTDLTGSVSQVTSKSINAYPSTSVTQALEGKASGVQVLQNTGAPGDGISVRIRGANSLQGNNEPLYVIDGFPTSDPSLVNNADIASIEILKDASATAIYGSRGANGVVLITTNRGKAGKTRVTLQSSYSTQTLRKKLDLMNAKEYALFYNEQATNDNMTPYFSQAALDTLSTSFDWQGLVFRNAPMKTLSINVSGGNEKTKFSLTGSTMDQDGIIKGSDYKRYSLDINIDHEISRKFNVNFTNIMTRTMNDQLNDGT